MGYFLFLRKHDKFAQFSQLFSSEIYEEKDVYFLPYTLV